MANAAEPPRRSPAVPERRRYPRAKIGEVIYIDLLDGGNGGLLLNISEGGLLLQSALEIADRDVSRLRFRLPISGPWIEARASLVWVDTSGKKAGARFLDLPDGARATIEGWVASGSRTGAPTTTAPQQPFSQQTTRRQPAPVSPQVAGSAEGKTGGNTPQAVQQSRKWRPPSYARTTHDASLPWWGLVRVLGWMAIIILAIFLGARYSSQLKQLPIPGKWKKVWSNLEGYTNSKPSLSTKAAVPTARPLPQAGPSDFPAHATGSGGAASSSVGAQSTPASSATNGTDTTLGSMVMQTLPANPPVREPHPAGIRSPADRRPAVHTRPRTSDAARLSQAAASEPAQESVLVGAPAVGAPPARVIVGKEAVSASALVAVTERRSILVPASSDPTGRLRLGKLVSHVNPTYPDDALGREIQGTVRLRAFIGRSGEVTNVRLLSGPQTLAQAAIRAIRAWRYAPTLLDGQPIKSQADISVFFRLP